MKATWFIGGSALVALALWCAASRHDVSDAASVDVRQVSRAAAEPSPPPGPGATKSAIVATVDDAIQELWDEAERLTKMARYPATSQPLGLQGDALAIAESEQVHASASSADGGIELLAVVEKTSFDAPEPIIVRVRWAGRDEHSLGAIAGDVINGANEIVARLGFARQAQQNPATDAWRLAIFTPQPTDTANEVLTLRIVGTLHDQRLVVTLPVVYTFPLATLTGRFRDAYDDGDLIVDAQVAVSRAADYRIDASLYGATDRQPLVCGSAAKQTLAPGTHWVRLRFSGLALRDLAIDGPYVLGYVALTASTPTAEARTRVLKDAHVTAHYSALAFSGEPEQDAEKLLQADDLRARARRLANERWAASH